MLNNLFLFFNKDIFPKIKGNVTKDRSSQVLYIGPHIVRKIGKMYFCVGATSWVQNFIYWLYFIILFRRIYCYYYVKVLIIFLLRHEYSSFGVLECVIKCSVGGGRGDLLFYEHS